MSSPARGMVTCRSWAMSGSRPVITNSVMPIAKVPSAREASAKARGGRAATVSMIAKKGPTRGGVDPSRGGAERLDGVGRQVRTQLGQRLGEQPRHVHLGDTDLL